VTVQTFLNENTLNNRTHVDVSGSSWISNMLKCNKATFHLVLVDTVLTVSNGGKMVSSNPISDMLLLLSTGKSC